MEGPVSLHSSMLYLWLRPMPFNPMGLCKYQTATLVKTSRKTSLKLLMPLHLRFYNLISKKVLTNLQGSLTIMVFKEQLILKRCLSLHRSKTIPREPRMSLMNNLNSHSSSKRITTVLRPLRNPKEAKA